MIRVRTRCSEPKDDGGSEGDGGEEGGLAAIVAGCDATPVLETSDHDLDAAATPVPALVVPDRLVAGPATRDAGLDAFGLEGIPEPVGVIASVAEQPLRLGQVVEQRCGSGVVADLARGHEEAQGAAVRIADGKELRVHAAFGAPDQALEIPFFTRRLDPVRCAFR